ncbi:hypothetical protein A2U01_0018019, partial [Trifolium medium]|nr:hypothetical protein [Trifolium medium]
ASRWKTATLEERFGGTVEVVCGKVVWRRRFGSAGMRSERSRVLGTSEGFQSEQREERAG